MAALGIDIVLFALGIFFILKVIRQLVMVVGYSVDEPITRTLTCLIDCNFLMGGRGASQNLKVILFLLFLCIVSIKMVLHLTLLSSIFSLLYLIIIFFFYFFVFESNIVHFYQYLVLPR